jgi:hypothetical protein
MISVMNELSFIFSGTVTHLSGAVKHFAGTEETITCPEKPKTPNPKEPLEFPPFLRDNRRVLHKPWNRTEGGACRVKPEGRPVQPRIFRTCRCNR